MLKILWKVLLLLSLLSFLYVPHISLYHVSLLFFPHSVNVLTLCRKRMRMQRFGFCLRSMVCCLSVFQFVRRYGEHVKKSNKRCLVVFLDLLLSKWVNLNNIRFFLYRILLSMHFKRLPLVLVRNWRLFFWWIRSLLLFRSTFECLR